MTTDAEFMDAITEIDRELTGLESEALPSKAELCEQFNKIKPWVQKILPVVEAIPVWGGTLAKVLRLLLMIGSSVCAD
ncbi:hypothetical protein [Pukyongiella litopenaei]|uniref:Uncharacterized protein n=1 Tax=Pukyongiella litopenaei TaxID=2605946 RepID=A0A2S0MMG8_9RHOB|nr:hypothetical protein [Pukyongiella litopenaei]AVO37066.1 hypothetical protein C6Y53_04665 [Pukyongiella litopenaei]